MTAAFYNKAHGIILAFDVSQEESFRSLTTWIRDIKRVCLEFVFVSNIHSASGRSTRL
jgi:GTPase SAR1 family protein